MPQRYLKYIDGLEATEAVAHAAMSNDAPALENLIKEGISIDETSPLDGKTALHTAAARGYTDVVRWLLDYGANPDIKDDAGNTAQSCAQKAGHAKVAQMLEEASKLLNQPVAERVTLAATGDINERDAYGYTALHWAASRGNVQAVRDLIAQGADLNKMNSIGLTALTLAAMNGCENIVRLLIDNGADINMSSNKITTPLGMARHGGYPAIVQLLKDAPKRQKQLAAEKARAAAEAAEKAAVESLLADTLSDAVASGNIQKVRDIFDQTFWEKRNLPLGWGHLKTALLNEDSPMMRLLITRGAAVADEAAAELTPQQITLLRQCGLRVDPAVATAAAEKPVDPFANHRIEMIPDEWLRVLQALQNQGAHEAVIAGGALRDTFNGAEVRDVDMFLQSRGDTDKNKKFLKEVFRDTKLQVAKQGSMAGYGAPPEAFPDPRTDKLYQTSYDSIYGPWMEGKSVESWTIIAGPQKTEYNIVFVDGPVTEDWKNAFFRPRLVPDPPADFAEKLIGCFDFGVCQIASDGEKIITTAAYDRDVADRQMTAVKPNPDTPEHQARLLLKYPAWALRGASPTTPATAESGAPGLVEYALILAEGKNSPDAAESAATRKKIQSLKAEWAMEKENKGLVLKQKHLIVETEKKAYLKKYPNLGQQIINK